jgi:hypothetical protein
MMMKRALAIASFALVLAPVSAARAGEKADVKMPDQMTIGGKKLVLNGMGVREATMFNVNVYVAGLYLEKKTSDASEIVNSEQVKHITLTFVRDVDKSDITEAWSTQFKKNGADMAKLKSQINQLNSWMAAMEEGDAMTFTYVPQRGVNVVVKRAQKGVITGSDFQHAFFAIWFGKTPPNAGLKSGMLGK